MPNPLRACVRGFAISLVISFVIGLVLLPLGVQAQPPDREGAAAAILAADRAFNQSIADRDRAKFLSFIAENAVFVGASEMRGHEAILKGWDLFFQKDGPTLTWGPTRGEVLVAADVGYTVGSWVRRSKGPDPDRRGERSVPDDLAEAEGRDVEGRLRHRVDGAVIAPAPFGC